MKKTIILAAVVAILGSAAFAPTAALARSGGISNGGKSTTGQSVPRVDVKPKKPAIHSTLKLHCHPYRRPNPNGPGSITLYQCN